MKQLIIALALTLAAPASNAQDFSQGSTAKTWNLAGESPARFEAKVVDLLCEVAGQCTDNCGDGRRQLGLLRTADNVLVYPNKNSQAAFTGATVELLPYCGQTIEVDGLMITDEELGAQNIYLLQKLRVAGAEDWIKANRWTKDWAKKHPEAKGKGPWFRRDPRVKADIAANGYLGLGQEADKAFIEDWF